MAFKMKGPSLYSSSPMKQDTRGDGFGGGAKEGVKKIKRTEGKLKKKGSVNIPVNPKAPKVKVPKNNTSIKGTTQFERDTKGIRNVIGRTVNMHKRGAKKVVDIHKKAANKVKDYFTKR